MDRLKVTLIPRFEDCQQAKYRQAQISINDVPLIELVRTAEEPWVRAEYEERRQEFENPAEFTLKPGAYMYLPADLVLLPCRNLLDQPGSWFELKPDDPERGKAALLGCDCGDIGCWLFQVRAQLQPDVVAWSDFGQFHRPEWRLDLGPFVFDRRQYEAELTYYRGIPEQHLPYFESLALQEPDVRQWRRGAELCRRWLELLDNVTQADVEQIVNELRAEPMPGSAWADVDNHFRLWATSMGFRV